MNFGSMWSEIVTASGLSDEALTYHGHDLLDGLRNDSHGETLRSAFARLCQSEGVKGWADVDPVLARMREIEGLEGLRIPDDLSVIAFDDTEEVAQHSPPLASVSVPRLEIGRLAGPAALPMRKQMRTFRDMRFRDLMPQRFDFSCGSAALGTLLHYGYGIDTNEAKLITAMADIQSQSTSNPNSIAQVAAEAALLGDQTCVTEMCKAFKARHDALVADLNSVPGISCAAGDGTFYVFPNVEGLIRKLGLKDDYELSDVLLEKALVALVPGSAFGTPGHVRLSFATSEKVLKGSVERIRAIAS